MFKALLIGFSVGIGILSIVLLSRPSPPSSALHAPPPAPTADARPAPASAVAPEATGMAASSEAPLIAPAVTLTAEITPASLEGIEAAAEDTTPASLRALVAYATSADAALREAAVNAILRRDDVAAAPMLRQAAKTIDDSATIIALLQTADYLELPPVTMGELNARKPRGARRAQAKRRSISKTAPKGSKRVACPRSADRRVP